MGEERIAAELLVKLGIQVSPRTVRRYLPPHPAPRLRISSQAWSTFVRNLARAALACDFFVVVTATFRLICLRGPRCGDATHHALEYPGTSDRRMDRTALPHDRGRDQAHRFVIHDRDSIYSEGVDRTLTAMGLTVLRTPVRTPQANAFCERLIGTIRRECLDFVPLTESHLRAMLGTWVTHYNRGRPHRSLGPDCPIRRLIVLSGPTVTSCPKTIGSLRHRFWPGSITNTARGSGVRAIGFRFCG